MHDLMHNAYFKIRENISKLVVHRRINENSLRKRLVYINHPLALRMSCILLQNHFAHFARTSKILHCKCKIHEKYIDIVNNVCQI